MGSRVAERICGNEEDGKSKRERVDQVTVRVLASLPPSMISGGLTLAFEGGTPCIATFQTVDPGVSDIWVSPSSDQRNVSTTPPRSPTKQLSQALRALASWPTFNCPISGV